ncbi:MAG: hypothetical protein EON55_02915 [Alphaproteobacteria bacterium]|nr:MAG: hypothetical protein EON55_02915 [Alphaproteobacteria bacterium]
METDQSSAALAMADEIERLMALAPNSRSFTMKGTREELSVILAALRTAWVEDGERAARFDRLLIAFHDAIRGPLGVTPDSGLEFYDRRLAEERGVAGG